MKNKKTLEEVAEKLTNDFPALQVRFNINKEESYDWFLEALQKGAKWQQERSYSKKEVMTILYCFHYDLVNSNIDTKEKWFNQFKKK